MTVKGPVEALTAPELLKRYRAVVNANTTGGRDLRALKDALQLYTPAQLIAGFYQYQNKPTLTVSQFLRQEEEWLIEDEQWAEIELARCISHVTPKEYWLYLDLLGIEEAIGYQESLEAKKFLIEWAERILN